MIRILLFILAIVPGSVSAEPFSFSNLSVPSVPSVKLNVIVDSDLVYAGDSFKLYLSVKIDEGWHIYSLKPMDGNELLATQIILEDNTFKKQRHWQESRVELIQDDAQKKLVKGHVKTAVFHNSFRVPKNFRSGSHSIKGKLLYKACDNSLCSLPQILPFITQVHVGLDKR
jgi:hypothetical protein